MRVRSCSSSMKWSEVFAPRRSRLTDAPVPEPGMGEILVRILACGVCGSEYPLWAGAKNAPLRLGHEVSGEVVSLGAGVRGIRPGDPVTGLFRPGFAEYTVSPAEAAVLIPEGMGFQEACLGEPVACAVSGALRIDVGLGKTVAVIGLGFMGLIALQLLRMKGAFRVLAVDTRPETESAARRLGADEFFLPADVPSDFFLTDSAGEGGVDVVAECSGTESALDLAVRMLKRHSILSVVGYHQGGPRSVDFQMLNWKAADVINAHEKRKDFKMECLRIGLALAAAGRLELGSLITHRYDLDEVDKAFKDYEEKAGGYIKGVVLP